MVYRKRRKEKYRDERRKKNGKEENENNETIEVKKINCWLLIVLFVYNF
jgi:hypothetical protein